MKLLSTKDLKRLLEEGATDLEDLLEATCETAGPCREIKIDREHNKIILLVDRREIMNQTLDKFGELTVERVNDVLSLWRSGKMDEVRKSLGLENT